MMEIKYRSSNGKSYDLIGEKMRATSGNFHKYAWAKNAKKANGKERLIKFEKEPTSYQVKLTLRGELGERKEMLNDLIDSFEQDIVNKTPGTIYFGEYYIKCFIINSESKISQIWNYWSDCAVEIYCLDPFWIKETSYTFKSADITSTSNKRYGYRYGYRYASGMKDTYILNEHFAPAQFRLRIYGPCVNPLIAIGGRIYTVHTILEDGEYLEVDSMAQTVIKTMMNGTKVNLFHYRGLDIFQKILPGKQVVSWDGKFDFDITLFKERSEPEW